MWGKRLSWGPITNHQKFVALSNLVEGLSLKVTGVKCPQTFDDSLFASLGQELSLPFIIRPIAIAYNSSSCVLNFGSAAYIYY